MKRGLLLSVLCTLSVMLLAEDIFLKKYEQAKSELKKGNYVEAQRKFISIAEANGKYLDVWDKIKECNKKIADKQSHQLREISSLKAEKEQLSNANAKSEAEWNKERASLLGNIQGRNNIIEHKDASIGELEMQISEQNKHIKQLHDDLCKASNNSAELVLIAQRVMEQDQLINKNSKTISDLNTKITQSNDATTALQEELARVSDELESANQKITKMRRAKKNYCDRKKIKFKLTKQYCNCNE